MYNYLNMTHEHEVTDSFSLKRKQRVNIDEQRARVVRHLDKVTQFRIKRATVEIPRASVADGTVKITKGWRRAQRDSIKDAPQGS